ncbi:hypothetical protein [Algoriphagus sp.]|uniref:hypothetical protein n=1 Tax=Algoriphagus sp. TaxID=1872435 RepID=UPI002722E2B9|nr:hypothetical protein [Algoriphagus sp.]MDO8968011.1 hypothetical protein [Algoriphagus sp.]MDP3199083.1 hypothetical protein [Algoriphagus sp.]
MKKALLTWFILAGLVQVSRSQEILLVPENLNFQSETEKNFWQSGTTNPLLLFMAVQADQSVSNQAWVDLVEELDNKASKSSPDLKFLRLIFEKTNHRLFKTYEPHSTFNDMLTEGKFNCVSGSAALGLLLDRYGFAYDIVETDYHAFILVNFNDKKIVLESTLPIGGMIIYPTEVKKYLESYRVGEFAQLKSLNQSLAGPEIHYGDNSIFRKVSLHQLAGLQYYNDAIIHFNSYDFGHAIDQLSKATILYPSDRILGLRELSMEMSYRIIATK